MRAGVLRDASVTERGKVSCCHVAISAEWVLFALFRPQPVRKIIGRKCRLKPPARWHPGKGSAFGFIQAVEFPDEFAGIPTPESPPDFEYLEGRFELKALQDFQIDVQSQMRGILDSAKGRAIVTLPTGAGKTRLAVDTIRDWLIGLVSRSRRGRSRGAVAGTY